MLGKPPPNSSAHALDFSRRYAHDLEIATGQVMMEMNLSRQEMGMRDIQRGSEHHTFYPNEKDVGGISPTGHITVDSGIMNLEALDKPYGEECGKHWRKSRLRDRMQANLP